ncbi:MAG: hypothetical protein EBS01_16720, partial [Verrucomicrobia bacterium]|nr:hypothetical protein [Verrucomicrobiota bacterium]
MNIKMKLGSTLLALAGLAGALQAQTVNFNNNLVPFYMNGGSFLLNPNTEYYIGTFGTSDASTISGYFGSDNSVNYNALFSNFSILASFRDDDGGEAGRIFSVEAGETETALIYAFNGNKAPSFFNGKPIQLVVLSPLDGQNSPGNLLQLGIYGAYDFAAATSVNYLTGDIIDVNNFAVDTQANGDVGATAALVAGAGIGAGIIDRL